MIIHEFWTIFNKIPVSFLDASDFSQALKEMEALASMHAQGAIIDPRGRCLDWGGGSSMEGLDGGLAWE